MLRLSFEQLRLVRELYDRGTGDPTARTLAGVLTPIVGDAQELLEFVRQSCPTFTRHNIQHSLTIIDRIGNMLAPDAISRMTAAELFLLILAALFHDSGMTTLDGAPSGQARASHPQRSGDILRGYLQQRVSLLSEHNERLGALCSFVIESHGLSWEAMTRRREFQVPNSVFGGTVRCSLLAVLLRIGDLLDLDADRSCDAFRRADDAFLKDAIARTHHDRHKRVTEFYVDPERIHVRVEPHTREEHQIWSEWLQYLEQDVLRANGYLFVGPLSSFRLPVPSLEVVPAQGTNYVVWPLRFELDDSGRLWDVISQSIYTGRFDFVRELTQNAIDAALARQYLNPAATVEDPSPRTWSLEGYAPSVCITYSAVAQRLTVRDNGTGMGREELESFLFRIAKSGFREARASRPFPFPSIAAFGLGFVSVLTRASRLVLTSRRPNSHTGDGRALRVVLSARAREAFVELADWTGVGTFVDMQLQQRYDPRELREWLSATFVYPTVPVAFVDADALRVVTNVAGRLSVAVPETVADIIRDCAFGSVGAAEAAAEWARTIGARAEEASPAERKRFSYEELSVPTSCEIRAARSLPRLAKRHAWVTLDGAIAFGNAEVPKSLAAPGVLWIPVTFDDRQLGIEWRSVHAFLLSGRTLCERAGVPSVRGRAVEVVQLQRGSASRKERWNRSRTEYDDWAHQLRYHDNEIAFFVGKERVGEILDYIDLRTVYCDDEGPPLNEESLDRYLALNTPPEVRRLRKQSNAVGGKAYQDGIPLPVKAWWCAPLGACDATMNLTAGSRMQLNVTRSDIDHDPRVIAEWCDAVGTSIQRQVVKRLTVSLRAARVEWDVSTLIRTSVGRVSPIRLRSEMQLRGIIRDLLSEQ